MKSTQHVYSTSSTVRGAGNRVVIRLVADARRPVRLCARVVKDLFPIRLALEALGAFTIGPRGATLDPVVTVHSDRVSFETMGLHGDAYARVSIDRAALDPQGEVSEGTSTVDVSPWFWEALPELRSSQQPLLRVEPGRPAKGQADEAQERRIDLEDAWLRRTLELQVASIPCSLRLALRPIDLMSAIRVMRDTGARAFPQALRFQLDPGRDATLVMEPWEEEVPLRGAGHTSWEPRGLRAWGRRWLLPLSPLLPHARQVSVFLHRSGWPSFYVVTLPSVTFVLGVTGDDAWSYAAGRALAPVAPFVPPEFLAPVLTALVTHRVLDLQQVIRHTGLEPARAQRALARLCRAGRALFEVETNRYRHRELFALPMDIATLERMDPKTTAAESLVRDGGVEILSVERRGRLRKGRVGAVLGGQERTWWEGAYEVQGVVGGDVRSRVVIRDGGKIIFGSCSCSHFCEWMMSRGPCEHMFALALATEAQRLGGGEQQGG